MLKLKNITKKYGSHVVLNDITINFDNPEGVYGILGRNGVGKTTLMKIIFNMITRYQGQIELNGEITKNNDKLLKNMVYSGGEVNKYNSFYQGKIKDLLKEYRMMYDSFDQDYAESMLERYGISTKQKFSKLSTGNKTLVQNTIGLATRAPITILDEPTNGLDSVNRQTFFQFMMEDYADHPRLFMLSTHLIQEVENYLTDVVILKDSAILIADTLERIQLKSHLVSNYQLENKVVISETTFGSRTEQIIYDDLSDDDINTIKANGGEVKPINLQQLFNELMQN
ncbi:hypothetical protein BW721_10255 [Jeotgalibaca sp. PTS2502]|uniref:ATP-binding cassette domain-containing protein n=1 Tax=Jeotgalibaca sp. PTS2502 TaxID=1903686 RepID=UPI0009737DAE|nr:ABC transporter ATP-binding protein [Jeotgalibaca sp. PTS2502]APZ49976.1 hypothetical protein BW721_10255 [Jeotgalibaca sp. PTS2502]